MSDVRKFPSKTPKPESITELFDNIQKLLDNPVILKKFIDKQIEDKIVELSKGRPPEYEKCLRQFQWGIQKNLRKCKDEKVKLLRISEMLLKHAETLSHLNTEEMRSRMWKLD